MRKILMIAYHFPPLTTSGSYRSYRLARYLPAFGWAPVVLTTEPGSMGNPGMLDPSLLKLLPETVRIVRAPVIEPLRAISRLRSHLFPARAGEGEEAAFRREEAGADWRDRISDLFSLPDRQAGWIPAALSRFLRIAEAERIDAVYSSSPPESVHLIALLGARATSLPWAADFRDPWVGNPFAPKRSTRALDPLDRRLEGEVVRKAGRVVANTEEMRESFLARYPEEKEKLIVIPNGFDPEEEFPSPSAREGGGPLTITHAGTLYGPRDPSPVLRALRLLLDRGDVVPDDLRLRFVGVAHGEERWLPLLDHPGMREMVLFQPKVTRKEAFGMLARSDVLLLIQGGTSLQIPAKVYEYLLLEKPILAVAGEGATARLVREEKLGLVVSPSDIEGIAGAFRTALAGRIPLPAPDRSRYDFRNRAADLARELEELIS